MAASLRAFWVLWALLLLAALPHRAAGQDFQPGYIVQLNGDSLRGEVQVRGAMRSATQATFRAAGTTATNYQPTQLQAYGLRQGPAYQAKRVPPAGPEAATVVFMQVLVAGRASLYAHQDRQDQTRYYLAVGSDSLQELRQIRVPRPADGPLLYEEQSPFRGVLARALRACPAVQPLLPQLAFTGGSLTHVVRRYNECLGGPATTTRPAGSRERSRLGVGLVAGLERSSVQLTNSRLADGNFVAASPLLGACFTFASPVLHRRLALRLEVLYQRAHYADAYVARYVSTVEEREQARFDVHYLQLPLQVRYHFTSGKVRPFALAGVSFNYLLAYAASLRSEYTSAAGPPVVMEYEVPNVTRADYGVLLGAGLATPGLAGHAIGLEVRGELSTGFLAGSAMRRLGLLVSVGLAGKN